MHSLELICHSIRHPFKLPRHPFSCFCFLSFFFFLVFFLSLSFFFLLFSFTLGGTRQSLFPPELFPILGKIGFFRFSFPVFCFFWKKRIERINHFNFGRSPIFHIVKRRWPQQTTENWSSRRCSRRRNLM